MDIGTGLVVFGSASLVTKLLGPTADYLGAGLKDWTKKAAENVKRIFDSAFRRLGDRIEEPGAVPPKVLARVLQEGAFCEDPLTAEYFGGVLASSRSGVPRDDRGAALMSLLGRLSTYQIRTHYVFYTILRDLFKGTHLDVQLLANRKKMRVSIPASSYVTAMAMSPDEAAKVGRIALHSMRGLRREALIGGPYYFLVEEIGADSDYTKLFFQPSPFGAELFLWVHGHAELPAKAITSAELDCHAGVDIDVPPGSCAVSDPERRKARPSPIEKSQPEETDATRL